MTQRSSGVTSAGVTSQNRQTLHGDVCVNYLASRAARFAVCFVLPGEPDANSVRVGGIRVLPGTPGGRGS